MLVNIGAANEEMKKYSEALGYYKRAVDIYTEIDSKYGLASCLINIGDNYRCQKKYPEAIEILNRAMEISKEVGLKDDEKEVATNLSQIYEEINQPQKALEYYKLYSNLKDTIFSEESTSQMNELSTKYEADKRQKEIELLTKDQDLKNTKLKEQHVVNITLFIGITLVVILMGLVFYRYQEKRKANTLLEEKNIAIHEQKELVTEKNKEITDSINYARRIQDAMLPSQKILNEYFKENFIFYQPKDIISGDFYWASRKNDQLYIAAADCTGHGVPGALMSMIGISFLRQIINEMNVTDTAEILNRLHNMVLNALNEDVNMRNSKDGMDIALLKIDIGNKKAEFTGAVRPLYISGKNGFEIIKGDRFSIGGIKTMEETFSKTEIDLSGGKSFYMFSDGFADQFGKESGKKFMVKKLQNFLSDIVSQPMEQQHKLLDKTFNDWKGDLEQTDDVLLIGIRV
ncbi:MAG: tetratricopeptide repeat protein [Bacteroidia bacterium]